jgi:hypothetical protein
MRLLTYILNINSMTFLTMFLNEDVFNDDITNIVKNVFNDSFPVTTDTDASRPLTKAATFQRVHPRATKRQNSIRLPRQQRYLRRRPIPYRHRN